jgi:hypothetical protein
MQIGSLAAAGLEDSSKGFPGAVGLDVWSRAAGPPAWSCKSLSGLAVGKMVTWRIADFSHPPRLSCKPLADPGPWTWRLAVGDGVRRMIKACLLFRMGAAETERIGLAMRLDLHSAVEKRRKGGAEREVELGDWR